MLSCQEQPTWQRFVLSQVSREDSFLLQVTYFSIFFLLAKVVPESLLSLLLLKLIVSSSYHQHGGWFILFFFIADFYIFD